MSEITMNHKQWSSVKSTADHAARNLIGTPYGRHGATLRVESTGAVVVEVHGDEDARPGGTCTYRVHPDGTVETTAAGGAR